MKYNPAMIKRWEDYASRKIRYYFSLGFRLDAEPREVVQKLICDIIFLKRHWQFEKVANINTLFIKLIRSELSNRIIEQQKFVNIEKRENIISLMTISQDDLLSQIENKDIICLFRKYLEKEKDPWLLKIFDKVVEGREDQDIAEALGLPKCTVLNKHRIMLDHLRKYFAAERN